MNNIDDMWPICHDCPYWEVCEQPYICEATEEKQNKTADEMEPELLKVLPPKEELQRIFEESGNKDGDEEGSED